MRLFKNQKFLAGAVPHLAYLLGQALYSTLHVETFGSENLARTYQKHGQAILAFWHNRLLLLPYMYCYEMGLKNIVAMVSQSRDGQYMATYLERFKFHTIRGSSSTGGVKAFIQAVRMARQGYDVAIATDGPRGPRYEVQPGVIKLAQVTSLPIVPAAYQASVRWELNSWDGFILPGPFAKVVLEIAPAITVPRKAGDEQLEEARQNLQRQLESLNQSSLLRLKQHCRPISVLADCVGNRRD